LTQPSPDHLAALHVVQQKLGHCVLRLQAYELGLKEILKQHDVVVTAKRVKKDRSLKRRTLGALVRQLFGSLLTTEARLEQADSEDKKGVTGGAGPGVRVRTQIELPEEEFVRLKSELEAFRRLRNDLIHHFRERHDLGSHEGCQSAEAALNAASARIERHIADLRTWAGDLQSARQALRDHLLHSDIVQEWVKTGRLPGQSPRSGH
jgi:hypothetical protein